MPVMECKLITKGWNEPSKTCVSIVASDKMSVDVAKKIMTILVHDVVYSLIMAMSARSGFSKSKNIKKKQHNQEPYFI